MGSLSLNSLVSMWINTNNILLEQFFVTYTQYPLNGIIKNSKMF